MTMFKRVNGVQVEMTPEEEQAVLTEWNTPKPPPTRDEVKAECKRRILAVADAETQQNITQAGIIYSIFRLNDMTEAEALSQAGLIAGDMTTAAAFRDWIAAMSQAAGALIAASDETYQDDAHWPPIPEGVAELAGRF